MTMYPKPGIVRLKGKKMEALRIACFLRDQGKCTGCGRNVLLWESTDGRPIWGREPFDPVMHMAHIQNKRNHGDVISNVTTRCPRCHLVDMHNPKSVPAKEKSA